MDGLNELHRLCRIGRILWAKVRFCIVREREFPLSLFMVDFTLSYIVKVEWLFSLDCWIWLVVWIRVTLYGRKYLTMASRYTEKAFFDANILLACTLKSHAQSLRHCLFLSIQCCIRCSCFSLLMDDVLSRSSKTLSLMCGKVETGNRKWLKWPRLALMSFFLPVGTSITYRMDPTGLTWEQSPLSVCYNNDFVLFVLLIVLQVWAIFFQWWVSSECVFRMCACVWMWLCEKGPSAVIIIVQWNSCVLC